MSEEQVKALIERIRQVVREELAAANVQPTGEPRRPGPEPLPARVDSRCWRELRRKSA